jgi:hypothetical protein
MIQAYIDLELSPEESKEVCKHLKICEKCRKKYDEMSALDAFVEEKLAVEEKAFNFLCKDEAWDRFTRRPAKNNIEKRGVFYMINRYKKIVAGAAAAVLISSIIWVAPVRNAAADFLSIFRVSKFKAVTFTSDDLARIKEQLEEKGMKNIDLKQYGRVKVEGGGLSKELKFEEGSSSDEVLKSALKSIEADMGIDIALPEVPEGFRLTNIRVSNPARIEITPNVKNLNQLISTFGGTKFFPEVLDGKTFAISVKNDVVLSYEGSLKRGGITQWITIQETESPDIHVPDNVDLEAVRDAVVSLPFIPENLRQQLVDIKDWKNTLPVPVGDDTDVKDITVNGNQGVFISTRHIDYASNTVVWSDGKFMYWINTSLPEEQVLQIAESLR